MTSKQTTVAALEQSLSEVARRLGFTNRGSFNVKEKGINMCFWRQGIAETEAICFSYTRQPHAAVHVILLASRLSAAQLEQSSLGGNATGVSLFDYQFDHLEANPSDLLGKSIDLRKRDGWRSIFNRLESELKTVDPTVWHLLGKRLGPDPRPFYEH